MKNGKSNFGFCNYIICQILKCNARALSWVMIAWVCIRSGHMIFSNCLTKLKIVPAKNKSISDDNVQAR